MFCPKCATQNIDGAHFCRSCGANISLIPDALSGQLPTAAPQEDFSGRMRRKYRNHQPTLDGGIRNIVMGFGFVAVALALAFFGQPIGAHVWWFWMLIPAFGMLGRGIAEIVRARTALQRLQHNPTTAAVPPRRQTGELPPEPPGYVIPPPSVTEQTTRHLDPEKDRYPQSR